MAFGLDPTGFTLKTLADIRAALESDGRNQWGQGLNVSPDGAAGQMIGIVAGALDEIWQGLQASYDTLVPQNAEGVLLDNLAQIIGLTRLAATESTAPVTLTGTADTVVVAATKFSVGTGGDVYLLDEDVTLTAGTGTGTVTAQTPGSLQAAVGSIDTIVTPVAGLSTVTNTSDALVGRDTESDVELRQRLKRGSQFIGSTSRGSIESRIVQQLEGITDALVRENASAVTVGSLPPHSIQVVLDGIIVSEDVVNFLASNVPAGIETVGASSGVFTDSRGNDHTFKWSAVTLTDIGVDVTVTTNSLYPADGDAQARQAVVDIVDDIRVGEDILNAAVLCEVFQVPGIVTVTIGLGPQAGPIVAGADISIGETEKANIDDAAADVTVVST